MSACTPLACRLVWWLMLKAHAGGLHSASCFSLQATIPFGKHTLGARGPLVCLCFASSPSSPELEVLQHLWRLSRQVYTFQDDLTTLTLNVAVALNYPLSRGTATAFPLAAFGLSAFLFSAISAFTLRDDTSKLLLLLAIGTVLLPVISFPFVRIYHSPHYDYLPSRQTRHGSDCQVLHRAKSTEAHPRGLLQSTAPHGGAQLGQEDRKTQSNELSADGLQQADNDEASSLLSNSSNPEPGDCSCQKVGDDSHVAHDVRNTDVRGFALLPLPEFWQLFLMLGLLTGIGLMTIK
jgi:hypothetical protein